MKKITVLTIFAVLSILLVLSGCDLLKRATTDPKFYAGAYSVSIARDGYEGATGTASMTETRKLTLTITHEENSANSTLSFGKDGLASGTVNFPGAPGVPASAKHELGTIVITLEDATGGDIDLVYQGE